MVKARTYAVVDIETTGTNPKEDRIIQIGCVLVENGKIVARFATDINPNRMISKQIQNLTGISNSQVQSAPYFEDVALIIYNLLADTTFVAHNIYFDYKFLNHELKRCGAPELTIPGIDTVELAQIFLPAEPSFRLSDLAVSLGLEHENPHQADSDAEVTAQLLLTIEAKMRNLPLATMEQVARLSALTGMETSRFIHEVWHAMEKEQRPLSEHLESVEGIVLRKKTVPLFQQNYYHQNYPKRKVTKEKLFGSALTFRKEQARLMNLVYDFYTTSEEKNLLLEAATGMGKTIGYLLPLSYLATAEEPVIISTVSILLQEQLLSKEIPLLNTLLDQPIQATVVKSQRHYLDLQRFKATLNHPTQQKQYSLYQMAVLVWLTETITGDFSELNMTKLNHTFWQDVRHRGTDYLNKTSPLYEHDFLRFVHQKMAQSNVLIVNHAFLVQESLRSKPLLPKSPYLLIDEAHHLPYIANKISHQQLDTYKIKRHFMQIMEPDDVLDTAAFCCQFDSEAARYMRLYADELEALLTSYDDFTKELTQLYTQKHEEVMVFKEAFDQLSLPGEKALQTIQLLYTEMLQLQEQLLHFFTHHRLRWSNQQQLDISKLMDVFEVIQQQKETFDLWGDEWQPNYLHWFVPHVKEQAVTLHISDLDAPLLPQTSWYNRYTKIVFIGGSLKVGNDRQYFQKLLGIPEAKLKVLPNPYDYSKQAKLLIPTDAQSIQGSSNQEYAEFIAKAVTDLAEHQQRPILVLFTAHDILQRVYHHIHLPLLEKNREVLAQGTGGSREKLIKRFYLSKDALLLGTDSFWEGIDFPGDVLQLVVVTRLPFENPQRPLVKARNNYLLARGVNPFYQEALPKAALKLRQALGRLIRSEKDTGILLVLDRRLTTAAYSTKLLQALPKELPVIEQPLEDQLLLIDSFFEED